MDYCLCGRRAILIDHLCRVCYDRWLARQVALLRPGYAA